MFSIRDLFDQPPAPVRICDIGAMCHGLGTEPYHRLIEQDLARVVGFEPDDAEREKAQKLLGDGHEVLPQFVGNGEPGRFHRCRFPMTSSLYEPDLALMERFQNLAPFSEVVAVDDVSTVRLDDVAEAGDVDFLKMDIQGAECDVIAGAPRTLERVMVVQTEVMFVALYRDQPLFAEVDQALRGAGFQFHKFIDTNGRAFKPLLRQDNPMAPLSQLLWSDAIYVRDFRNLGTCAPEKLVALAVVLHEVYKSYDLAHVALSAHDSQRGGQLAESYLSRLTSDA